MDLDLLADFRLIGEEVSPDFSHLLLNGSPMGEDSSDKKQSSADSGIDLSALDGLSLGPRWSTLSKSPSERTRERGGRESGGEGDRPGSGRREQTRNPEGARPRGRRSDRGARGESRQGPAQRSVPFRPTCTVQFFAEEAPFKVLTRAIKASFRTFELFELARLILDKPERFVVFVRPIPAEDGAARPFFVSQPDGLPFRTEEEARQHVFAHYMDRFFEIETAEVEPPKGSFQVVNRCGLTGELLGPPNYHRYQALLHQHYVANVAHVPYERFLSSVESLREQEQIDAWLEKMTRQTRYTVRAELSGAGTVFDNPESAQFHLLRHHRDMMVRETDSARFSGRHLELLPERSDIRRSVVAAHEHQMRFPLETANHLRGRLRRLNFAIYKKGAKGVSYVCAVKRRFRDSGQDFADSVQSLITFIEQHPDIPASDLPERYLGLSSASAESAAVGSSESAVEGPPGGTDPPAPSGAGSGGEATPDAGDRIAEPSAAEPRLSPDETKRLNQLRMDLRWLLSEGYVIEYSDGRLFAPQPADPRSNAGDPAQEGGESQSKDADCAADTPETPDTPESDAAADSTVDRLEAGADSFEKEAESVDPGASATSPDRGVG